MSNGTRFEPIFTPQLSPDEKATIWARITPDNYNRFLRIVYEAYQNGQEVFTADDEFRENSGFEDWFAVNIAKLLVDDGYLEQQIIAGMRSRTVTHRYLRITPEGIDYCKKLLG